MPQDMMGGPPPAPGVGTQGGPTPSFKSLSPNAQQGPSQAPQPTPGGAQVGGAAVNLATQIDQALKLLAQAVPSVAPWVEQTVMQLRQQIGQALQSGGAATSPQPAGAQMPDGSQNL